jgi:hypothetical protein
MVSKRSQFAAWEAARALGVTMASRWNRELTGIARDVTETKNAAIAGKDAAIAACQNSGAVLNILLGKDSGALPGQTDLEKLNELQMRNRSNHNQIRIFKEREGVRLRDLFGETPAAKAAREAKETTATDAKAAKAAAAKTAKEEKKAAKEKLSKESAEQRRAATAQRRTIAADRKRKEKGYNLAISSKRQKTDGIQTTISFQASGSQSNVVQPAEPQVQEETKEDSKEQANELPEPLVQEETKDGSTEQPTELQPYKPLMIPLGEPCPVVGKNGKCGRPDLCFHRKRAGQVDERAAKQEILNGYQAAFDQANAVAVRYWVGSM